MLQTQKELWPVMLTPFTDQGKIDEAALGRLIEWYQENGANGLFAVCQSSEMFWLTEEERLFLASFVKRHASIPVIASGHVSDSPKAQEEELLRMMDTGVDAVVMISNRLACADDNPAVFQESLCTLLERLDAAVPLGMYECPHPYKRLLSDEEIRLLAQSGRFRFLKDTCCDMALLERRLEVVKGSSLGLFNANSTTLLPSLQNGAAGFSGVMANFHPHLYRELLDCWETEPERAQQLQSFLAVASFIERQLYPINAKYHLMNQGIFSSTYARSADHTKLTALFQREVQLMEQLALTI